MPKAQWIFYPGDYEIYHAIKLHSRREAYGAEYPSMWALPNVYPRLTFYRYYTSEREGYVVLYANCFASIIIDGKRYPKEKRLMLPAGSHTVEIQATKYDGLPSVFVESDLIPSGPDWKVSPGTNHDFIPVGCDVGYYRPDDDVQVFPFTYTDVLPVSVTKTDVGMLCDFGRELFAVLTFTAAKDCRVIYGETVEEASDPEFAIITDSVPVGHHELKARAFRFVTFMADEPTATDATDTSAATAEPTATDATDMSAATDEPAVTDIVAKLELLAETYRASFTCDNPLVGRIFDTCAYTFHLNSREFLLDGIKRDRWCWSGDAYQSYMVNNYLFADDALNRRTISALYGKPPYLEHINRINDYSALLIIGTWDYYFTTGDMPFLRSIWTKTKELYRYIVSRLNEDGLVVPREGDWIFIDWSDFDKTGAFCPEQILLWQTYRAMSRMSAALGEDAAESENYLRRADELKRLIDERYWDSEKQAYIDSYESGRRHVTRHAAVFAVLFDFVDAERAEILLHSVLENDAVTKITTPYFALYELMALCKLGNIETAQRKIDSYWGGMLSLGATTIWEQFDPTESGIAHYQMYGDKYGKSLCHAWGSGPVYLLGRYCVGVAPTSVGSKTFTVSPNPGLYREFCAVVPVGRHTDGSVGSVRVEYRGGRVSVLTDTEGGTLCWNGKAYPLPVGQTLTV